jgi:hypothetical protein
MVPAREGDVQHLALIHALRANADAVKRVGVQQDRISDKIGTVHDLVHDIDKRLAVIEGNSLSATVSELDERVQHLEQQEQRRIGAVGLWEWGNKSWPAIIAFISLIGYAVLDKVGII